MQNYMVEQASTAHVICNVYPGRGMPRNTVQRNKLIEHTFKTLFWARQQSATA